MRQLKIDLLGPFQVTLNGNPVTDFQADSARALLAYLAIHAGMPVQRETLADLFWPEQTKENSLHALSQALNRLRKALGDSTAALPFLLITRDTLQFNPAADYELDVASFRRLLSECQQHAHRDLQVCRVCIARLEQAAALYRADLLSSFSFDSHRFEEWHIVQREQLHHQAIDLLYTLAAYHERRGQFERACQYAWRQIELEPWREEAYRQLMRSLAFLGQRSTALAQYQRCRQTLKQELGIEPDRETITLYEQIQAGKLEKPSSARHNLPAPLSPFVGRQLELAQIADLFNHPDCRLLTLVGPGGVGKSRLVLQAAAAELGMFRHGVYFVPLSAVSAPEFVSAIAQALQFTFNGSQPPWQQLHDYLREKEILLVLDSFEHLLAEAGRLSELLRYAPHVRILTSSRKGLNVQGEWLLTIKGMPYPGQEDGQETMDIKEATAGDWDAVRLFVQTACRNNPGFSLSAADRPEVESICRLVDGIPLAIELAANWLRIFSCREIAREIRRDLDFLCTTLQDLPERHRSLRAVFDSSWALLTQEERTLFQRLSVFHGNFRREAAELVAGATPLLLAALVDKSLLTQEMAHDGCPHYKLHNLLWRFATEKLAESQEASSAVHNCHCEYYLNRLVQFEPDLKGSAQRQALEAIGAEIGDVRAAWDWAVENGRLDILAKSMDSMFLAYDMRYWFQEGVLVFRKTAQATSAETMPFEKLVLGRALACLGWFNHRIECNSEAQDLLRHSLAVLRGLDAPRETAAALNLLGAVQLDLSLYDEAKRSCQESLALCQQAGEQFGMARALSLLSQVAYRQSDYAGAQRYSQESLVLARAVGGLHLEADSLCRLGNIAYFLGHYPQARDYYEQVLQDFQALDNTWGKSIAYNNLAAIALLQGEYQTSREYFEQILSIKCQIGDRRGVANVLSNLGFAAYQQGDYPQSIAYYEEALPLCRAVGDRAIEGRALQNFGAAWVSLGCYDEAQNYLEQALQIRREIGERLGESVTLRRLGLLCIQRNQPQLAYDYSQQALHIAQAINHRSAQSQALVASGEALLKMGRLDEAAADYEQSLSLRRVLGEAHMAIESQAGLARVALVQSALPQALACVEDILSYLAGQALAGPDDPLLVYLTCYRVLQACHDQRAREMLERGYQLLREQSARIGVKSLRDSFMENVVTNQEILRHWESDLAR